jgi:hypothetical protein
MEKLLKLMTITLVDFKCDDDYYFDVLSLDYFELEETLAVYPMFSIIKTTKDTIRFSDAKQG